MRRRTESAVRTLDEGSAVISENPQVEKPTRPDDGTTADPAAENPEPQYPEEPGLLDDVADRLKFRDRIERNPTLKHAYKVGVGIVGFVVLVAGIIMIPFPGPGWLVVIAGLAILSTEFVWAERLLKFTKRHVLRWTRWIAAQKLWIRLVVGLLTCLFVYGVVVVALHITGVPGWVPDWIPLWH